MTIRHRTYMKRALELAARGRGRTSPNPMVGAVIVKDSTIIAEGYHRKAGTSHAEILALRKAGDRARGATLYSNLEPCCHTDKKTPPCTKAIISSGIKKVVVAMIDPNPKVAGRGMRELIRAGISIEAGVMEEEAQKLNEAFIKFITTGEPYTILKIAQSLDGKIATAKGESQWITGEMARTYVHGLRNEVDAVLVGTGTALKDNPSLDCRTKKGRNPYRIVVDSALRIPRNAKILKHNDGKTIIATTKRADDKKIERLRKHARVLIVKEKAGAVNLKSLMKELGNLGITSVMIEGGSAVNAAALRSGIVDKVMFFIAPKIIGGADAVSSIGGKSPPLLRKAYGINDLYLKIVGRDILVEAYPSRK